MSHGGIDKVWFDEVRTFEQRLEYFRDRMCMNGHNWTSPVVLSDVTTNLSGERTEFCPRCGCRQMTATPAYKRSAS